MSDYSQDFQQLISDPSRLNSLLTNCHYRGSFQNWENERKFIVQAIDRDGTILDIGCANGFFLRCLQEWSPHKLVPYGIDTENFSIREAQELFSSYQNNFAPIALETIPTFDQYGLPRDYDLIYWNVWDNRQFDTTEEINDLKTVFGHLNPGGRLILGFYDRVKVNNQRRVEKLPSLGINSVEILENPVKGKSEIVCWFNETLK